MIGIGTGFLHDLHSLVKVNAPSCQKTDQLRNNHGRMGIIDLNHCIIRQIVEIASFSFALIQNILRAAADHKILLVNPQLAAILVTVIRI